MQIIDTLIHAAWLIPIEPINQVLKDYSLAIDKGKILDILPTQLASKKYISDQTLHLADQAVLPGFINAHTHSPMSLLRGIANDLALMDWLQNYVWPAEKKWLAEDFVYDGTQLALAEMIRGGTTCFNEHYFFPETISKVTNEVGLRACVGFTILDFPTNWSQNTDEAIAKGLKVCEQYKSHPLITIFFAPHAPYTLCDDSLKKIISLTNKLDIPNHIHVHESNEEINNSIKTYNQRPLKRLYELGILNSKTLLIHMVHTNDEDLAIVKKSGSHVVHCPESNLKLASGFFKIEPFQRHNINVALGTDSAASNNNLDMIGEMRTAALIAKCINNNPCTLTAAETLAMATINGAKALGLDSKIGSLKIGKFADIISINLKTLATAPVYDPIAQIVYASHCNDVTNVWVAGKQLLNNGNLTTINESEVLQKAKLWGQRIVSSQ